MRPLEQFYYRQQFDMPYQSEVILDMIADGSWTISDVLSNVVALHLASPATAFKYLSWLRDNDFADVEPSLVDGRIKFITPSTKGIKFLQRVRGEK